MITKVIQCDNSNWCGETGPPEWMSKNGRKWSPPYGWISATASIQGPGPTVSVEVCSTDCLLPAIQLAFENAIRKEREG
jgi:hypothetical protein